MINLRIAFLNLVQHYRRTLFLGGALAGVTMFLVVLTGMRAGVEHQLVHTATTLSTGHVNIGGFFKITSGASGAVVTKVQEMRAIAQKTIPEMAFMVERGRGWAKVVSDTGSLQAGINGVDIKAEPEFRKVLNVVSGNVDDLAEPNTILLFESQLEKLGKVKVGDAITLSAQTERGTANTIDLRIVAVARDVGLLSKWNTYVPSETIRRLYQLRADTTGAVMIYLKDRDVPRAGEIAGRLRAALEKSGHRVMEPDSQAFWMKFQSVNRESWTGQKLDVTTWEDELSFLLWTRTLLAFLSTLLITILLAIVVTGIMNTMWIAIRERTREIGALRAMGMQRGSVLVMFLLESVLLGLGATAIGVLLGSLVAGGLNAAGIRVPVSVQLFLMSDELRILVRPESAVATIVGLTIITALAALYPSMRAARLKPIEAMSHFG